MGRKIPGVPHFFTGISSSSGNPIDDVVQNVIKKKEEELNPNSTFMGAMKFTSFITKTKLSHILESYINKENTLSLPSKCIQNFLNEIYEHPECVAQIEKIIALHPNISDEKQRKELTLILSEMYIKLSHKGQKEDTQQTGQNDFMKKLLTKKENIDFTVGLLEAAVNSIEQSLNKEHNELLSYEFDSIMTDKFLEQKQNSFETLTESFRPIIRSIITIITEIEKEAKETDTSKIKIALNNMRAHYYIKPLISNTSHTSTQNTVIE